MALTVRTNVGALSAIKTLNSTQNSLNLLAYDAEDSSLK